jgi:ABC-2 type transport system permease protein
VVSAKKIRADAAGNEQEAPMDALVDIGVRDAKGDLLFLEKRRVHTGENRFTVEVAGEPARAGIDPLHKLIDRDVSDNLVDVTRP